MVKRFLMLGLMTVLFAAPTATPAVEPGAAATREIDHLMRNLATSGCRFNRNGSWYDAARASAHLRQKYDYLRRRDLARTAEEFIDKAATNSSVSGKPYLVKCRAHPAMPSAEWMQAELAKFRQKSAGAAQPGA